MEPDSINGGDGIMPATSVPSAAQTVSPASPSPSSSGSSWVSAAAGAIPVVGGIISGLINSAAQKAANQQNEQFQIQQQNDQNAYNMEFWQMQTNYNNPANMMARYAAAGLNPNLIYGNASGNLAAAIIPSVGVSYTARPTGPDVDYSKVASDAVAAYNSSRSTDAQVDNLKQDTTNKVDLAAQIQANTVLADANVTKVGAETSNIQSDTALKDAQTVGQGTLNAYSGDKLRAEIDNLNSNTALALTDNETKLVMRAPTLAIAVQQVVNLRADALKTAADANQANQSALDLIQSAKFKSFENALMAQGINPSDATWQRAVATFANGVIQAGSHMSDLLNGNTVPLTAPSDAPSYRGSWESQLNP